MATAIEKRRARNRRWNAANRERMRKINRRWYLANREKVLKKSYQWGLKHPEKKRASIQASKQKWIAAHPELHRARSRQWKLDNPVKASAQTHRHNARKKGNGGSWTSTEWAALKKLYGHRCLGCGKHERTLRKLGRALAPDHVLPLAKGGRNEIANLQPLCHGRGGCNNRKHAKHVDYPPTSSTYR